jgi:hypothetical protein
MREQQLDDRSLKLIAQFTAELLAAVEERGRSAEPFSWPEWLAAINGIDLNNPAFADGRHLRRT